MHRCVARFSPLTRRVSEVFFPLPSVMEAGAFTKMMNRTGRRLEQVTVSELSRQSPGLRSSSFDAEVTAQAQQQWKGLTELRLRDVESVIQEKYQLQNKLLITCLVPYQLAVNIILARMPPSARQECVQELREEEDALSRRAKAKPHKWIQWREDDIYVSTGLRYLQRAYRVQKPRIPVFTILGHSGHGKTALLAALMNPPGVPCEPDHHTQRIKAVTTAHPHDSRDLFTFLDNPGLRLFVETRFHSVLMADYALLVISVTDGVQSQTHEAIKVVLNVDKPIIVVLTKLDLFSDTLSANNAIQATLSNLKNAGLDVSLVRHRRENQSAGKARTTSTQLSPESSTPGSEELKALWSPLKELDPSFTGSRRQPVLNPRRRCLGVCVSSRSRVGIDLLWSVLRECRSANPPLCWSDSANWREQNGAVQAVVVESSKHLLYEEALSPGREAQRLLSRLDAVREKQQRTWESKSAILQGLSLMKTRERRATGRNRTSSSLLVITVIVKEGCVQKGMHFVADQAEGEVQYLMDFNGNPVERAVPGMVVTIVDADSNSGCPGAAIHLLSTSDRAARRRIHAYRQILQWYVECFPSKLFYLRPRGMDTSFAHLGDYGQLKITDSLEYQLLYGPPPAPPAAQGALPGQDNLSPQEESLGKFLADVNARDEAKTQAESDESLVSVHTPDSARPMFVSPVPARVLESTWRSMQRMKQFSSQEEYEKHLSQCLHLGVVLRVDSWHSARMLYRELPRLGTEKVNFQVLGVRFGCLEAEDFFFFGQTAKIIVCYRTPLAASAEIDTYITANDTWVIQTEHIADVIAFLKWCAVEAHKEQARSDETKENDAEGRHYVVVGQGDRSGAAVQTDGSGQRNGAKGRRLLAFTPPDSGGGE